MTSTMIGHSKPPSTSFDRLLDTMRSPTGTSASRWLARLSLPAYGRGVASVVRLCSLLPCLSASNLFLLLLLIRVNSLLPFLRRCRCCRRG